MEKYHLTSTQTPQTERARADQVKNLARGYGWHVSDEELMLRFLILGATSNTYYASKQKITREAAQAIQQVIAKDYMRAVDMIVDVSDKGRAPKNDPAIYALAIAASDPRPEARAYALVRLGKVCRIPTHLFHFAEYVNSMRGWGPALKRAIANWYEGKDMNTLAFHMMKYQSRDGWSHADLLRLAHVKPSSDERSLLYQWATLGFKGTNERYPKSMLDRAADMYRERAPFWLARLMAMGTLHAMSQKLPTADALKKIEDYSLSREMIPTELMRHKEVWTQLVPRMGYDAMLRNLVNAARHGALLPGSYELIDKIIDHLSDETAIKQSRIHPLEILKAHIAYTKDPNGADVDWPVVPQIAHALNEAMYMAFDNVAPTGQRIVLAIDHSSSMTQGDVGGVKGLNPREASAVMAMTVVRSEPHYICYRFGTRIHPCNLHKGMSLKEVMEAISGPADATDLSLPIQYALENRVAADAFVIYTDNQTWAGPQHVYEAINRYRKQTGIPAKLVLVAMTPERDTVGDPGDPLTLNVVGFDSGAPQVIQQFISA